MRANHTGGPLVTNGALFMIAASMPYGVIDRWPIDSVPTGTNHGTEGYAGFSSTQAVFFKDSTRCQRYPCLSVCGGRDAVTLCPTPSSSRSMNRLPE